MLPDATEPLLNAWYRAGSSASNGTCLPKYRVCILLTRIPHAAHTITHARNTYKIHPAHTHKVVHALEVRATTGRWRHQAARDASREREREQDASRKMADCEKEEAHNLVSYLPFT